MTLHGHSACELLPRWLEPAYAAPQWGAYSVSSVIPCFPEGNLCPWWQPLMRAITVARAPRSSCPIPKWNALCCWADFRHLRTEHYISLLFFVPVQSGSRCHESFLYWKDWSKRDKITRSSFCVSGQSALSVRLWRRCCALCPVFPLLLPWKRSLLGSCIILGFWGIREPRQGVFSWQRSLGTLTRRVRLDRLARGGF